MYICMSIKADLHTNTYINLKVQARSYPIQQHSASLSELLGISVTVHVEISQLLGSLDFFFFFQSCKQRMEISKQHQGLLFCWLSCSAGVICFSKTSRNAKVGLREHTHFLCRKDVFVLPPSCDEERGRQGDMLCSIHLSVNFVDC